MSIFFDFHVGSSGRRFRRAVDADKYDIELFVNLEHNENIFGHVDIGTLIELSTLSICMINENKQVVGFLALNDYPNVLGVDPADWEIWIRNMFQRYYLSSNTLFIHFMCCKHSVVQYFLSEALVSVFHNDSYLLHIVLIVASECTKENLAWYNVFKKRNMCKFFARKDDDSEKKLQYMCVALRQDHCPKLKIRYAVEEDNDDICEMLDKSCPRLKQCYGEYYISEIIGRHPENNRKIIVAEHQEKAVGVMCLNPTINYKKLQSIYDLRPHYGLRRATPLEKERLKRSNDLLNTFGEPIMSGKWSPFDNPPNLGEIVNNSDTSKENLSIDTSGIHTPKSKVYFKRKSVLRPFETVRPQSTATNQFSMDHIVLNSDDFSERTMGWSPTLSLAASNFSMNLILEEDPFDYDIVNIDTSLLGIGPTISFDVLNISHQSSGQSRPSETLIRKKKKRRSCKPQRNNLTKKDEPVMYRGEPNAFMIELFGLREDIDEGCGYDLLEVAFQIMKDFEYCIIRVPSAYASFPLLQHFCLVPTKPRMCCAYSLFIAHRASVIGKLRVREAEFVDIPSIARLFQNIQGKETIWAIENCILEKKDRKAYVFISGLSLVGIGILQPPEKLNFLRAKFNMDPFHNHKYHQSGSGLRIGFAAVDVALVYPVFEPHFRFFAREMMRLSGSTSLVWMTAYRNKWVAHKANSTVSSMVPLLPRKSSIDIADVPEISKLLAISKNIMAFSTWFLDKKLTSVPRVIVSTKIVVLGASRTAMAFLNTLLFGNSSTYLTYTNITLISSKGLPYMRRPNPAVELMFPRFQNNTEKYLKSVPYTYYVNVVQGTMAEINKADKHITLSNGSKYHYDLLFLLLGIQYQHPQYLQPLEGKQVKCEEYARLDIPRATFEPEVFNCETPDNVFIINNTGEASKALKYVKSCISEYGDAKILVYGSKLETYCCLAALLEMKVPPENIVFVEPFPSEYVCKTRVSVFYNENVDETVSQMLANLKIKVYRSYYFESWHTIDSYVVSVDFLSQLHKISLECAIFFYYGKRGVNTEGFFAVHRAGLAYDGGIIIDHEYRTKDPYIYAAGPATAYYRKYYASTMNQKYYDSYEIGEKLGTQIQKMLDPLFTENVPPQPPEAPSTHTKFSTESTHYRNYSTYTNTPLSSKSTLGLDPKPSLDYEFTITKLPQLVKPKVKYCKLPGGLQYLDVRPPGKKIPHYYLQSLNYSGHVMETFKGGYFKIHMSPDLIVDGLTCLTPSKYSIESLKNIYGFSSVVLNNVHLKYMTKKLDDFYEFFRSPWACFLYHDQAAELFAMVKELLPKGQSDGDTIYEGLRQVDTALGLSVSGIQQELRNKFDATRHLESITDYVLEWLSENDVLLPMYLQPSQRTDFDHDADMNQVFRKKKMSIMGLISKIL